MWELHSEQKLFPNRIVIMIRYVIVTGKLNFIMYSIKSAMCKIQTNFLCTVLKVPSGGFTKLHPVHRNDGFRERKLY